MKLNALVVARAIHLNRRAGRILVGAIGDTMGCDGKHGF